jgi:hypothetical protein
MAVRVITLRNNRGGFYASDLFENGTDLQIRDEHLYVLDSEAGTIGIYGPGKFVAAHIEGESIVKSED